MDERRRALHIDIADDTGGKYPLRGDTEKRYENEKSEQFTCRNQNNEFGERYQKYFVHKNTSRDGGCTSFYIALTVDTVYAFQTALHC